MVRMRIGRKTMVLAVILFLAIGFVGFMTRGRRAIAYYYSKKGYEYLESGDYESAVEMNTKAIKWNRRNCVAYCNRGVAFTKQGLHEEALRDYKKVLTFLGNGDEKAEGEILYNIGETYAKTGKYTEAIDCYDRALEINPNHYDAHIDKGTACFLQGKFNLALEQYDRAISINPSHYLGHSNKGGALEKMGRWEAAVEAFSEAIRLKKDFADAYSGRGYSLFRMEQYQEAVSDFTEAIRLRPGRRNDYKSRGYCYVRLGLLKEAAADLEEALRLSKQVDHNLRFTLTLVYRDLGTPEQATELLKDLAPVKDQHLKERGSVGVH